MNEVSNWLKKGLKMYGKTLIELSNVSINVVQGAVELSSELTHYISEIETVKSLDQKVDSLVKETKINVAKQLEPSVKEHLESIQIKLNLLEKELCYVKEQKESIELNLHDIQTKATTEKREYEKLLITLKSEFQDTCNAKLEAQKRIDELSEKLTNLYQDNTNQREKISNVEDDRKQAVRELEEAQHKIDKIDQEIINFQNHHFVKIENLETEKQELQIKLDEKQKYLEQRRIDLARITETLDVNNFSNLTEVLKFAANKFDNDIVIWDSAWKSAKISELKNSSKCRKIYEHIEALVRITRERVTLKTHGHLIPTLEEALKQKGFNNYKESETNATKNAYGKERVFYKIKNDNSTSKRIWQHLTIDGYTQIYFEVDDNTGKLEITYCGKHLPIPSYQ